MSAPTTRGQPGGLTPLPIDPRLPAIVGAVETHGAVVLVAEPGAGKTTRAPRALLEAPWLARTGGEILVLEPRRLAARMSALRVAEELGEPIGRRVGYQVRFEDVSGPETRLRFITEGILTRRLGRDPELRGVAAIVLDELHERSIHADLALAWIARLRRTKRPDLRLVAMSATIDASRFASFLDAPVIDVPGRKYDVAIEYAPRDLDRPLEQAVRSAVVRALASGLDGHVLVFLPGAAEIRRAHEALEGLAKTHDLDILPLHGELPPAEQDRAVRPSARRKIVLSTNVAETSLTIDGVRLVVDTGLARVASHSPWSGVSKLELAPISQASATQRAGRAGRTAEGRAIRLYAEHEFAARPAFEKPEIQRIDLAETLLLLACAGERDLRAFPFFERPSDAAIDRGLALLDALGLVDGEGAVTPTGMVVSDLPVHPRLGRMAHEAARLGYRDAGAGMAAVLSERELRLGHRSAMGRGGASAAAHDSGVSDVLARLESLELADSLGGRAGAIRSHELDVPSTLAALRTRDQLRERLRGVRVVDRPPPEETALLMSIVVGFPDRLGKRRATHGRDVVLAEGGSVVLAETSVVRAPAFVVAVEAEERRGAIECRVASSFEPEWLLELYPDRIVDIDEVRFDRAKERVERVRALAYQKLLLDESIGDAVDHPGAPEVLARAAVAAGIHRFVDIHALDQWRLRLALAHELDATIPLLDDAALELALREAAIGRRSLKELAGADVLPSIVRSLGPQLESRLERVAPSHVSLPGRPRVPVHYEHDRPPWLESRMQDFFGLLEGPRAGKSAIVLHLLAPNQRAEQVTTDLAGFWERHYPTLRRTLMRNYPKHFWPEDPKTAAPPPPRGPRRS